MPVVPPTPRGSRFPPATDDWAEENYPGHKWEPVPHMDLTYVNVEDEVGTLQGYQTVNDVDIAEFFE